MAQRVRRSHRGQSPSSARQLPILAALHARLPTLFVPIIQHKSKNVNTQFFYGAPQVQTDCYKQKYAAKASPWGEGLRSEITFS